MSGEVVVYFDGLCEPINPGGVACYGYVVYVDGVKVAEGSGVIGAGCLGEYTSNNVAEYHALIAALRWLVDNGYAGRPLVVRGDSQLVIRQLRGEYRVRAPHLKRLHEEASSLLGLFRVVGLEWIDRGLNEEADRLSRRAYEEFIRSNPDIARAYSSKASRKTGLP